MNTIEQAVQTYVNRKDRREHPSGKFDNAGRWYADDTERCTCCNSIRTPSRAYPYSEMTHCRTATHIANLYDVNEKELRKILRNLQKQGK